MASMDLFIFVSLLTWSLSAAQGFVTTTNPFATQTRFWWTTPPIRPTAFYTTWTPNPYITGANTGTQNPTWFWTTYSPAPSGSTTTTTPTGAVTTTTTIVPKTQTGTQYPPSPTPVGPMITPTTTEPGPTELPKDRTPYWYIAGAMVLVVLLLILIIAVVLCCRPKKKSKDPENPKGKAPENEYHEPHDTLDRHKIAPQAHYANRPESAKYDTHIEEAPQPSPAPSPAPEHHDMSPAALSEEDKNY